MAEEEKYSLVKNENPALVDKAKNDKGEEGGIIKDGVIGTKPNAKRLKRVDVPLYNEEIDNEPLPDKNPFSKEIKDKNDKARELIIPLLNGMGKTDRVRLIAISLDIKQEVVELEKDPVANKEQIEKLGKVADGVQKQIDVAVKGEEGIEFPPKEPIDEEKEPIDEEKDPIDDK